MKETPSPKERIERLNLLDEKIVKALMLAFSKTILAMSDLVGGVSLAETTTALQIALGFIETDPKAMFITADTQEKMKALTEKLVKELTELQQVKDIDQEDAEFLKNQIQ